MSGYPIPENENERLEQLELYDLLNMVEEEAFDRITRVLAHTLDLSIALISFVAADRQLFKSKVGIDISATSRDESFCAHAICQDGMMEIDDARTDPRFCEHPLVLGDPNIRFYAGVPLCVDGQYNLGVLCALDTKPRNLSDSERTLMNDLAGIVVDQLELRLANQRATKAENRLIDAFEAIPDGFVLYDENDQLVLCNQRYKEIYKKSADLFVPGAFFEDIIRTGVKRGQYPEASGREEAWITERMDNHKVPLIPIEQQLPGDHWVRVGEQATREGGRVGFRVDITQLKRQQRELTRLAWTDSLTGALNRRRFVELVNKELSRAKRSHGNTALLLIDIDHFKKINDAFGHAAGDEVLMELVTRWELEMREYDHLARIGGEEFAILLPQCDEKGAAKATERLLKTTSERPVRINDVDIFVTISAGLVVHLDDKDTVDSALARADKALYQAKDQGRNCFVSQAA